MKNDPKIIMYNIKKRKNDFMFWLIGTLLVLTIFIFLCAKEISALHTISSIVKTLSFLVIFLKVINYQNCSGLSRNSLICFFIALLCRIFVYTFFSIRLRTFKINILFLIILFLL